jgi:hypothetical protein
MHVDKNNCTLIYSHLQKLKFTSPGSFWPWPLKQNLIAKGMWQKMKTMHSTIIEMLDKFIQNHVDTFQENHIRDFIDAYLQNAKSCKDNNSSFNSKEWRKNTYKLM